MRYAWRPAAPRREGSLERPRECPRRWRGRRRPAASSRRRSESCDHAETSPTIGVSSRRTAGDFVGAFESSHVQAAHRLRATEADDAPAHGAQEQGDRGADDEAVNEPWLTQPARDDRQEHDETRFQQRERQGRAWGGPLGSRNAHAEPRTEAHGAAEAHDHAKERGDSVDWQTSGWNEIGGCRSVTGRRWTRVCRGRITRRRPCECDPDQDHDDQAGEDAVDDHRRVDSWSRTSGPIVAARLTT